jgi:lipopolysaccharide biosynthesis glycosyltransferase
MIEIITACDDNYIQHLAVMLCSLLENTVQKQISISVIDGGINPENQAKLSNFIQDNYKIDIKYLTINPQIYGSFQTSYHFTHTIYYRISIPSLLPSNISKALYLDCDLIVKDDIEKLWLYELDEYYLAAVESININIDHLHGIIPNGISYFNSGVLLINLSKWRENDITKKVIQFIQSHQEQIIWWDQDSLNAILYNQWFSLPFKWNQQTHFFEIDIQSFNRKNELVEAVNNPSIIHYTGFHKPWEYIDNHPFKNEYYKYLSLTPWKDYKPTKNIKLFIERLVRIYTPSPIMSIFKFIYHKYLT